MNNPQHYQPLAHALHHSPPAPASQGQSTFKPSTAYHPQGPTNPDINDRGEEEEDDGDDPDDTDEGLVEEQLSRQEQDAQGSSNTSVRSMPSTTGHALNAPTTEQKQQKETVQQPSEQKRRPGRPRGSKNRKPRAISQGTSRQESQFHQPATTQPSAQPQHPDINAQNQQFYEFQWRILNLCAEFYGAAEELVKGTSPLVLSQCYQAGSDNTQDPLKMLIEAKKVCDNLLANPSRFALNPPTSFQPTISSGLQGPSAQPASSAQSTSTAPSKSTTPMITNPQSFVVPLGAQATYPHAQISMFSASPAQYPASYYHQYSYAPPTATFYQQPIVTQSQLQPSSLPPNAAVVNAIGGSLNQGAWSEEETEKLKKLAEESRSCNSASEIEWDWVISQYGNSRTRHQILIKATALGLKESSSRGTKRRREPEDDAGPSGSAPPPPQPSTTNSSNAIAPTISSPAQSHTTATPADSPAMQNQQRPPTSKTSTLSGTPSNLPWPMPTVAVNTPSPVIAASTISQGQQRTSYYRPRTGQDTTKSLTHNYMYQPTNGSSPSGSRLAKENGK